MPKNKSAIEQIEKEKATVVVIERVETDQLNE